MRRSPAELAQALMDWRMKRDEKINRAFWDAFCGRLGVVARDKARKAREAAEQERLAWWC